MGEGPTPSLAYLLRHNEKTVLVSSRVWDESLLVDFGAGADLWVHGALLRESLDAAIAAAGAVDVEKLKETGQYWTALEDVGGLASQMDVGGVVLTRLTPPPIFSFQYSRRVREGYRGPVAIAEDGDIFTP